LLFTDIEGSTQLWAREPERMLPALARHDAFLRAAVESNHGVIVKTTGDGMYATFDDPLDALRATLAVQRALADPKATADVSLRVRCALHVGVVEHREGDYFGSAVNRAARIMDAAHGGQVLVSQSAADLLTDRLPAGVALRDLGAIRLRDLATPARVYQVVQADLRQDFPALRSLEATPNNLPLQMTSFVGRARELAAARALLDDARLVTIVGPGGIGKTRLSLQIAADVLDAFPDGVWFIEFASIVDPGLVPKTVAQVLGTQEDPSTPLLQALLAHCSSRRLLLVLDNCEHLVDACANFAHALLRAAPQVRVLASSREALHVAGEQTYPLPPLGLPDPGSGIEDAMHSDAGQLFVERARLRQPGFVLSSQNVKAVTQICGRLDGIPLALELAAARVGVLTVAMIAERLDDRFRLLTGGSPTALPRQQTLRAMIDWSYDLLGADEKTLFARLSVFAGGWSLPAAESVCADRDLASHAVLDLLAGLASKSLVMSDGDGARYRMLETTREYARERLQERGETVASRVRHRDYFVKFAGDAETHLNGGKDQPAWLARLDLEHDNLRAALGWSLEEPEGTESALGLAAALHLFWAHRGHAREGRQWCMAALARSTGRPGTLARLNALHASGALTWRLGDITEARSLLEQALTLSRELGDRLGEGRVLSHLGGVAIHQADDPAAQLFLEQAAAIHRATGNRAMEARVLNNVAALAISRGRFADSEAPIARALALSRELNNPMTEATALSHLGALAMRRGEFAQAQTLHERALATAVEFGVREFELEELRSLGEIALARGDVANARAYFRNTLAASREIGSQHEIVLSLEVATMLMVEAQDYEIAARLCGAADALRAATTTPRAYSEQEQYDAIMAHCRQAMGEVAARGAVAAGSSISSDAAVAQAMTWIDQAHTVPAPGRKA
jgi:predicted ATPase/class 3 adenylate cyclase/Tfp pilus assembly protein PilF